MSSLYNFATGQSERFTDEQLEGLMRDEAGIVAYLPQDPLYQSLFAVLRVQGFSIPEAMADLLRTYLLAGSAKRQIFLRGSAERG